MAITLTPAAATRAKHFVESDPSGIGLRFAVARTGCSGWGYRVDVSRTVNEGDAVFEQEGVKVIVDAQSLSLVDGTTIDFVRKGLNQEFVFNNPNAAAECGCGESFTTDADKAFG